MKYIELNRMKNTISVRNTPPPSFDCLYAYWFCARAISVDASLQRKENKIHNLLGFED